jgi:formate C-acetyltransferase
MAMTDRVENLRKNLFSVKPEICPERARYFTHAMQEHEGEPIALRRAKAFAHVLATMSIYVLDGELIVGNQASKPRSSPIFPEYSVDWLEREFAGEPYPFDQRPGDRFYYTEEAKKEILDIIHYWKGKTVFENLRKNLPENCRAAWDMGVIDDTWVSSAGYGNVIADYDMVLNQGLNDSIRRANEHIARLDLTQPGEIKKLWFLQAVVITNEAVIHFANRFAAKLQDMATAETDTSRKGELATMASNCAHVPANPARNFWEALQSVWFILLTLQIETNGHAISLGRFDQYLWPFYDNDIRKDNLTENMALELVEAFFIKANEPNKLRSWPDTEFFLGYQMFENLTIGGQRADGKDAVNGVSYLCLDACDDVKLFTPSVSVKWFEGTPDAFLDKALQVVEGHKGGQPAFYNDLTMMRILRNMGIAEEDLHNWAPVGCIEGCIPGKWDFSVAKGPWLNTAKVLELALNNGTDPNTRITLCPGSGDLSTFLTMDKVMEAFKKQLHYYMELQVITEHINDEMHQQIDVNAFRASLIQDCIGRGLSLLDGGSVYAADGGPTAGTITTGDSLAAINTALFEKKWFTGAQLNHALRTNFQDDSTSPKGAEIRQVLLNKVPKYGNDNDEGDRWSSAVADYIGRTYQKDFRNSRHGKGPVPCCYAYSQSPVTGNIAFGSFIGATPDGRLARAPVNNGISPCNGAERLGPTATVNSVAKLPSIWFQKGAIFNMRLTPESLVSEEGRKRAIGLIKTLFQKYGLHIQFNVVGTETLRDAQAHPENYSDLMVRVSGYSALFTPLSKRVQDDLIQRMEFELVK